MFLFQLKGCIIKENISQIYTKLLPMLLVYILNFCLCFRFCATRCDSNGCHLGKSHDMHIRNFFTGLLWDNYSRIEYPNINTEEPLIVGHSFNFESVSDVRLNTMDVRLVYWHTMSWVEPRIRQKVKENPKKIHISEEGMKYFWTPKIAGHPIKSLSLLKGKDRNIYFTMTKGVMLLSLQIVAIAACAMDLTAYPLDTQYCKINYESVDYGTDVIINKWRGEHSILIYPVVHNQLPEYDFGINRGKPYFVSYEGVEWSELNMTLIFKRRITGHILHTFIPSAIFVIMALLAFFIPARLIQPRWALVITSMLTLTTQMTSVRSSLPPMATLRGIDIWSVTCFFMMFVTLISMTIFTYLFSVARDDENQNNLESHQISKTLDREKFNSEGPRIGKVLDREKTNSEGHHVTKLTMTHPGTSTASSGISVGDVKRYQLMCFLMKFCFFFVFNIGFWSYYTKKSGRW